MRLLSAAAGAGDERFQRREVDLDPAVVHGIFVREQRGVGGGPLLCSQKGLHLLVCREDGAPLLPKLRGQFA